MKKNIKYLLLILFFFIGILFERFQLDKKILNLSEKAIDGSSRILYSLANTDKIYLNVEGKEYEKILETRKKALKSGILKDKMYEWSSAKLINNDMEHDINLRLKGAFPDHWSDSSRWSFKIKINNDSKSVQNLRRFNLQPPETLSYLYEWLLNKALSEEELISLNIDFYELILNKKSLGVYVMQEGISPDTLKRNKKQLGPIIGFGKNLYLNERLKAEKLKKKGITDSLNGLEDTFWRAKIEPVQLSEFQSVNKQQQDFLKKAIYLLSSFRKGELKPSQVFDIKKLAKVMAIRAALGSSEFDYRDTKFYFNPETSLLEPITKEIHVDLNLNFKDHYYSWWIDSTKIRPHYNNNTNPFINLLYSETKFYEIYLKELNKVSEKNYFQKLIKKNKGEFEKNLKILKKNYPSKKVFSEKHLDVTKTRIQDVLNPIQGLDIKFIEYDKNILKINVSNLQRLPIEVVGINFDDGMNLKFKKRTIIKGKKVFKPAQDILLEFDCEFKEECKKDQINNQTLIYKILGQKKNNKAKISKY